MMPEKKKKILQLSDVTIKAQSNLQTILCFTKTKSTLVCSFNLLERRFSQKRFTLNIVILVIMQQTFLIGPLEELNLNYLGRC